MNENLFNVKISVLNFTT